MLRKDTHAVHKHIRRVNNTKGKEPLALSQPFYESQCLMSGRKLVLSVFGKEGFSSQKRSYNGSSFSGRWDRQHDRSDKLLTGRSGV